METSCKNCVHNDLCKDIANFGIVPYEEFVTCKHYKKQADIIDYCNGERNDENGNL